MSNDPRPDPPFRIRRVEATAPPLGPAPDPAPAGPGKAAVPATGARFAGPGGVLAFLGAAHGMGLATEADCRRAPSGAGWWAAVARAPEDVAELAWAAGGVPFVRDGRVWRPVLAGGEARAGEALDVEAWPPVVLAELLAGAALRPGPVAEAEVIAAVMPGPLAGWAVRRALGLGLAVTVVAARRGPLAGPGDEVGALLVRLSAEPGRPVPRSLVQALCNMPGVVVGRPVGVRGEGLIVDVRYRLPMGEAMLGGLVPRGETWALGPPDLGHCRLRLAGEEVDGASVLELPTVPPGRPINAPARMPPRRPVRVVPCPRAAGRVDAVLVDDEELGWLRDYLPGRPAGELAFLMLGPGRHLLTGPGGLTGQVPFGVPMTRVGPGGLYVEAGMGFDPPLPEPARRQAFGAGPGTAVAVTETEVLRFSDRDMTPAWALWLGEVPAYQEGLSGEARGLLGRLADVIRQAEAEKAPPREEAPVPGGPRTDEERQRLLEQAMRAELDGDLVGAAGLLERAGQMARAGRLYERAARERM